MVSSVLEKPSSIAETQQAATNQAPRSRSTRPSQETKAETEKLHAKEIRTTKFKKLDAADANLDKDIQKLLKRYKVGLDGYHKAALSEDGKSLVLVHDGKTTLAQNFGGASSVSRFAYKVYGFLARAFGNADRNIATAKYREFFNNHEADDKNVTMVMEPIAHLFKGLSSNHYHGISIFHKDENTGKFAKTPTAVSIIDSYKFIFEEHEKGNEMPESVKAKRDIFANAYALDKTIPLDTEKSKNFRALYNEIAEGLYAAQGYSFLTIPGQVHKELNANSGDLNYIELPWHRVQQSADHKWRVSTSKKSLDPEALTSDADRKLYESRIIDNDFTNVTIVRPKDQAQEPLEPFIGYMENWSQMYSGNALRANDKDDKRLVDLAQSAALKIIETFNAEYL